MIERSRACRGGNHNQRVTNGSWVAIRWAVHNGELLVTFLLCNECSRSAAVQVNRLYTSRLQHDLGNFLHASATGCRLSAIQYHKDNLTCLSDTNCSSVGTITVIIICSVNSNLTILNQYATKSGNCFLNLILIGVVILLGANERFSGFQNCKETICVHRMIFLTFHN